MVRTSKRCALVVVGVCVFMLLFSGTASAGALHDAIRKGKLAKVERLIKKGQDLNSSDSWDEDGDTPLKVAAAYGKKDIAELLIAHGADVNARSWSGSTPLAYVANKDVAEVLIAHGADVNARNKYGWTPLHSAWNKDVAELLIAHGADVNARDKDGLTPLHRALSAVVEVLVSYVQECKGCEVSKFGDIDCSLWETVLLTSKGADVKTKGKIDRELGIMVPLISKGADVNTRSKSNFTALHVALLDNANRNIAEWLISQGADVNAKTGSGGYNRNDALVIKRYGEEGYKKVHTYPSGVTPLHEAAALGDKDMVGLLISKGARVNALDMYKDTPLDYATKRGHTEVAELLRRHGAR
jgi:ankyrin repeat protein